jgi:hypothetical protein
MAATTPAARGGTSTRQLGTALMAIALAIVVVAALVAIQATASRSTPAEKAVIVSAGSFDRGYAAKRGRVYTQPYAVQGDHGWVTESGKLATPEFSVPGDHSAATDGNVAAPVLVAPPRPFDPRYDAAPESQVGGGRGTRMAR